MTMRSLPAEQLAHSDIPHLFETVTAVKLDLTAGYSELLCTECEQRMRTAAQTRADLLRVVQRWQVILLDLLELKQKKGPLKAELNSGETTDLAETLFVECELGDVTLETSGKCERDRDESDRDASDPTDLASDMLQTDADVAANHISSDDAGGFASSDDDDKPLISISRKNEHNLRRRQSANPLAKSSSPPRSTKKRKPTSAGEPLTCDICKAQLSSM